MSVRLKSTPKSRALVAASSFAGVPGEAVRQIGTPQMRSRRSGGLTAAALALAVVPWRYGADRQPSTAVLLWLLPRLSADRVRALYAPYADARLRGPLLAFVRAAYRHDPDGAARASAEVAAADAAPNLVRSCRALVHGLRGKYLDGAKAAALNLDDLDRADASDFSLLFACVLAGLEAGQGIPGDLVDLARGHVGNLAQACERDEFAEKHALLALEDGKLATAERWARYAVSWATTDIVEGVCRPRPGQRCRARSVGAAEIPAGLAARGDAWCNLRPAVAAGRDAPVNPRPSHGLVPVTPGRGALRLAQPAHPDLDGPGTVRFVPQPNVTTLRVEPVVRPTPHRPPTTHIRSIIERMCDLSAIGDTSRRRAFARRRRAPPSSISPDPTPSRTHPPWMIVLSA
jgi:hypothetical protein